MSDVFVYQSDRNKIRKGQDGCSVSNFVLGTRLHIPLLMKSFHDQFMACTHFCLNTNADFQLVCA